MKISLFITVLVLLSFLNCTGQTLQTVTNSGNATTNNIGIGTSSLYPWGSNFMGMQLWSNGGIFSDGADYNYVTTNSYYNGTNWIVANNASIIPTLLRVGQGSLNFYTAPPSAIGSISAFIQQFVINSSGAGTFNGSVTASQFNGSGAGLAGIANSLSIGGNAYSATVPQGNYWNLVGTGGANDPYGTMSVSNPADANNHSYYAMTRNGQIPYGIGINTSNNFIIGIPTPGNNGSISNPLFTMTNIGAAWFNSSITASTFLSTSPGGGGPSASFLAQGSYAPSFGWYNTTSATDSKIWDAYALGYDLIFRAVNDANTAATNWMQVNRSGLTINSVSFPNSNVGIGTTNPQSLLSVNGTITGKQVTVTQTGWSDFVFNKDYRLKPLSLVANYIVRNNRLPGIPSAKEVEEKGLNLGEMQQKQMQKIEELTLYIIGQDKKINQLKDEVSILKKEVDELKEKK